MHPVGGCIKKPHGNHVDLIVFQVYTYGFKSAVLHSSLLGVYTPQNTHCSVYSYNVTICP